MSAHSMSLLIALGLIITIVASACSSTPTSDSVSAVQETAAVTQVMQTTVPPEPTETSSPTVILTGTPEPTVTIHKTTSITDSKLLEAAAMFRADFEDGYPNELGDLSQKWYIKQASDDNAVLCNEISDDWSSFLFGRDDWENYAVSHRMKFLSADEGQSAETYIRISQSFEGYRANIYDNESAAIGFYPPYSGLGESPVSINQDEWFRVEVRFVKDNLKFFINDEMVIEVTDDKRTSGRAGFGAGPDTEVCIDDIVVWQLDENGNPIESLAELETEPVDAAVYTISQKIDERPTVPVFYPWSGSGDGINCGQTFSFDCDVSDTPYSLIWISSGIVTNIESTKPEVSQAQSNHMRSDSNTIYIISEEWHYWNLGWRSLSSNSKFYLDEVYDFHVNSEYGDTMIINFEHPDWPDLLAEKALGFKKAGFDGMILDWWHNDAGNGRSEDDVELARIAVSKEIRGKVGDDFILMGNVGWSMNDPTAQYLSGVFLELWKPQPGDGYVLTYSDEDSSVWNPSIERMEDLLKYWDKNLQWPNIVACEPWKITTSDYIADRNTSENYEYAKLFTAMAAVIPDNGYILYADNNDDWNGGDHQHDYYNFYLTDLGKPASEMVEVMEGVAYKQYEKGIIAYNRTMSEAEATLSNGTQFKIGPLEGLFLEQ